MTQHTITVQDASRDRWSPGRGTVAVVVLAESTLGVTFWLGTQWGGRTHNTTVAWSDEAGIDSEGRPACLPPVGRGSVLTTFAYETVEVNGYQQNLAVWVECTTAQPLN